MHTPRGPRRPMFFLDPMPTPAGRAGRTAVWVGLVAWVLFAAGAAFYLAGQGHDDARIGGGLDRTGRVLIGLGVVALLIGMGFVAAGFTWLMTGAPDPGLRWVVGGLAVNALPMVGVAVYAVALLATTQVK